MSMFSATGKVMDVTFNSGFVNRDTGEKGKDYYTLHMLGSVPKYGGGTKPQVVDFQIPAGMDLNPFKGKEVTIQISSFRTKSGVGYSILEGSKPLLVSPPPIPKN